MRVIELVRDVFDADRTRKTDYWRPGLELTLRTMDGVHQCVNAKAPDPELYLDPSEIERIGSSGWDYRTGKAEWIAVDFDGPDHTKGSGNSQDVIDMLKERLPSLNYVDVFTSTNGVGLHAHVRFDSPVTVAKSQLSKLGEHVVSQMSSDLGLDLSQYVDVAGANTWLWKTLSL